MQELNLRAIAMNVRVARARANLSIEQLSKKSGVGMTSISFIENAKKNVRMITLEKLAKALEVSLEDLLRE